MFFAHDCRGQRVHISEAVVRQEYFCPSCGALLYQRRDGDRADNFAHMPKQMCHDTWHGLYDMSDWHYEWQSRFPYPNQEVLLSFGEMKHRADVLIGRTVVEFQHSSLSSKNFSERNNFYYNLGYKVVWVFDLVEQYANEQITNEEGNNCYTWSRPKNTFNTYDIQSGQVELFFQFKESDTEPCLVKVSNVSMDGIGQFEISRWYTKAEFLEYLGVKDGICALPNREDLAENETYRIFKEKYNINLNKQQERAVQAVDGANLLLAVPGSGKTTVLVARLGFMILCKNISPQNILAMTYTKAATIDMRSRFAALFGDELANQLEFRTINGIADIVIRTYAKKTGRPAFTLLSDNKKKSDIIRGILRKMQDEFPTENDIVEAETAFTRIKNEMRTNDEIAELKTPVFNLLAVYRLYQEELVSKSLMDYDDQLGYAYKILQKNPDILAWFHSRYQYICVDEAQDTSKLQHEIIRLLASKSNNIFMVGDEDQSIYEFRAAYPKALTNFKNDYPNSFILYMERNYRSTVEIVTKAAGFIEKNRDRHKKLFLPDRGHGAPVQRIPVKTRAEQYEYLLGVAQNVTSETAILYRDNDSAIPLIDLMLRNNVPFKAMRVKGLFFTNKVVLDIQAFLDFATNPYDADAFLKIYYKCGFGFNKDTAQWACKRSKRDKISIPDALIKQLEKWDKLKNQAIAFKSFISVIGNQTTVNAINAIEERYSSYMRNNNLDYGKLTLLSIMAASEPSINAFLLRLDELHEMMTDERTLGDHGVILSTVHSSKGLEYDSVYIMDVYDGAFPGVDVSKINESKAIMDRYQEERRLFYVAMTRAKNHLSIMAIEGKSASFIDEVVPVEKPKAQTVHSTPTTISNPMSTMLEDIEAVKQRRQAEMERKRREAEERAYDEVREQFTQQNELILDSLKRRWIQCEICGKIKLESEFKSYGGPNHVNLGVCADCHQNQ